MEYVKCTYFKAGRCGCLPYTGENCEKIFGRFRAKKLKKVGYEKLREPIENPSCFLHGVCHTETITFPSCSGEWSTTKPT